MAKVLELLNITRRFGGLNALQDVSFEVASGEILGLIGPNGAGKTTLVNVITGVHSASSGRVIFEDKEITHLSAYQTARIGLARTFQIVQPFPDLSVLDNVAAAALFSQKGLNQKEAREIARDLLQFVGLDNQVPNLARSLTLAMRKRLELAKALAMKPRLLFLDEVNAGLNTSEVERAMELIRVLAKQGITIVLSLAYFPFALVSSLCHLHEI